MVGVNRPRSRVHFHVERHGKVPDAPQGYARSARALPLDAFYRVVDSFGGTNPQGQVPVQLHARLSLRQTNEVRRFGVFEFPIFVISPHGRPESILAHDVAELHQEQAAHGVGGHGVGKVDVVQVGRGGEGFLNALFAQGQVAPERSRVRIQFHFPREHVHDLVFREGGKALVHPGIGLLVGSQHAVEPGVAGFVGKQTQEPFVRVALGQHKGGHGVFHAAVASLDDAELRVGVGTKFFRHEGKKQRCILGQLVPVLAAFGVGEVVKLQQGSVRNLDFFVDKFGVSGPHKVVYIVRDKAPLAAGFVDFHALQIAGFKLNGRNLHPGGAYHVGFGQGEGHIKATEVSVKLAAHVGVGVPTVAVVHGQFGVPLGHGIVYAFLVVAAGSADLDGHLAIEFEGQHRGLARQERLRQDCTQHGVAGFKVQVYTVLLEVADRLAAHFLGAQFGNAVLHPAVGVGNGPGPNVHHRLRLESIEIQVVIDLPKGVGAVVGVGQLFRPREGVVLGFQREVQGVVHVVLPVPGLGPGSSRE